MPQPIRNQCRVDISGLAQRPQHAAQLGIIVAISGRLENALGGLLAFMSRGSATITMQMFNAVASTDAQRAMLLAAAKHALAGPELEAFNEVMEDFRPRYSERSKLVHNVWGHSDAHPDKALLWKSADLGLITAQLAAALTPEAMGAFASTTGDLSLKAMGYTLKDLQDVAARLGEYTVRVEAFIGNLIQAHPVLSAATNAATNAPPTTSQSQLPLHQDSQTAPSANPPTNSRDA